MDEKTMLKGPSPLPVHMPHARQRDAPRRTMLTLAITGLLALFFILAHTKSTLQEQLDSEDWVIVDANTLSRGDVEDIKVPMTIHIMYAHPEPYPHKANLTEPRAPGPNAPTPCTALRSSPLIQRSSTLEVALLLLVTHWGVLGLARL